MSDALLTAGIASVVAAIVGGGLKAFNIEIPIISSTKRQVLLAIFGIGLIVLHLSSSSDEQNSAGTAAAPPASPVVQEQSLSSMVDEAQRLGQLAAKHKVTFQEFERDIGKFKEKYDDLKQSFDNGEGTPDDRARAQEVLSQAERKYTEARIKSEEAKQALSLVNARIAALERRIAERK